MKTGALILAGGMSRRMNYNDKAYLTFKGRTFIDGLIDEFRGETDEILLSMKPGMMQGFEGCRIVNDEYSGCGPMSGIHAALSVCNSDRLYVAACDMPKLGMELYRYLESFDNGKCDAVVPMTHGMIHPLAGIYKKTIAGIMEKRLKNGRYKLIESLEEADTIYVEIGNDRALSEMLVNINTLDEYEKLRKDEQLWEQKH